MISKNEYNELLKIRNNPIEIDEVSNDYMLHTFCKNKLLIPNANGKMIIISEKGNSAIEEYEQKLREEKRQIEANQIAEESLNKAKRANIIAIASIIIAALSLIFSVIFAIIK